MKWKQISIAVAIAAGFAGCASTEVTEYRAAPGAEVIVGKGGAVKVVEGVDIWLNGGTPPRAFKIVAEAKTGYRTGTAGDLGQRSHALSQLAGEAKKRGADGVIVYGEGSEIAVLASAPQQSTIGTRGSVTTGPGFTGTMKDHQIGALFVKYQ